MKQVEICCGSYEDGIAAFLGGAKRIELNTALSVGGLSPSVIVLEQLKKKTDLKIICMVRPRAGGFCFGQTETQIMMEEAKLFLEKGADGCAFGFLKEDGSVDLEKTKAMTDLIHSFEKEAVFHRAIDVADDLDAAIKALIACRVDRVLTSGQKAKAMEGIDRIAYLQKTYGNQIEILAGSGLNAENALEILQKTGIWQIHSSCKGYREDPTTRTRDVRFDYLDQPHQMDYDVVDVEKVKSLVNVIQKEIPE